jgi:hypothetical protein
MRTTYIKMSAILIAILTPYFVQGQGQGQGNNQIPQCGSVGIGTNTPAHKLEVVGDTYVTGDTKVDGGVQVGGPFKLPPQADANRPKDVPVVITPDGQLKAGDFSQIAEGIYSPKNCAQSIVLPIWQNDTSILYVACPVDAKVGIGTRNPHHKLHVNGTAYAGRGQFGTSEDTVGAWFQSTLYSNSVNHTNTVLRSSFQSDYGRGLIIQIDNPTTKAIVVRNEVADSLGREVIRLNGNGRIDARSFRVATNIWADYVFESDYNLMPLDSVENYIDENGHLPNVPTAEEVATDGYSMEQMDATQMEKIEELTLYMIQLKKEQEKQAEEIARLKAENEALQLQIIGQN